MTRDAVRLQSRAGALSELLALAAPFAGARLGIMAMGLTDTIVVGRFSADQLGFLALGWAPTAVVMTSSVGLLSGVQVMTSRALGEGRPERAGAVFRRGLVYALWIGAVAAAILFLFGPSLLRLLGLAPDFADGAGRVVRVLALSMPLFLTASATSSFLEGLGKASPGLAAMWVANAVNLGLNLVLVPGRFGLPAMGAAGAAWSTFGARLALMLALGAYVLLMPDARRLGVFRRPEHAPAHAAEQRRIGFGAGAALFMETAAFSGMNIIAGQLGGLAVAGWAIVLNVVSIIFMLPLGLAAATSVLVGRAYGARDPRGAVRMGATGFTVCALIAAVIALGVWPAAPAIARLYTTDPALVRTAAAALALACLFLIPDALQVVAGMALRARGDVWPPMAIQTASYAILMLPLGWVLAHPAGLGLTGIVWAVIAASFLSSACCWAASGSWRAATERRLGRQPRWRSGRQSSYDCIEIGIDFP